MEFSVILRMNLGMIVSLGKFLFLFVMIVNSSAAFIYDASRKIDGKSDGHAETGQ